MWLYRRLYFRRGDDPERKYYFRKVQPVSVSLENQTAYNMQRKTMMGLDLNYQFNSNLMVGATIMHMSEMPLTTKTTMATKR